MGALRHSWMLDCCRFSCIVGVMWGKMKLKGVCGIESMEILSWRLGANSFMTAPVSLSSSFLKFF